MTKRKRKTTQQKGATSRELTMDLGDASRIPSWTRLYTTRDVLTRVVVISSMLLLAPRKISSFGMPLPRVVSSSQKYSQGSFTRTALVVQREQQRLAGSVAKTSLTRHGDLRRAQPTHSVSVFFGYGVRPG